MDNTESRAMDAILEKGIEFKIPARGLIKYIRPEHTFKLRQAYLGTLLELTRYYLKTGLDEKALADNPLLEARQVAHRSIKPMARIAAIGMLNGKWKIRLFSRIFANYLMWRLTPKTLYELSMTIVMLNNTGDFLNSIRLTAGMQISQRSPADNGD